MSHWSPHLNWNSLATIDTVTVNWRQLIKAYGNSYFLRTKAKRLKIKVTVYGRYELMQNLQKNAFIDASILNVTEVTCVYTICVQDFKNTFPCKQVWSELEKWLIGLPWYTNDDVNDDFTPE